MRKTNQSGKKVPDPKREPVPPGATWEAADRPRDPGGGGPGSGAGPRHAADDEGSPNESFVATDSNQPSAEAPVFDEPDALEEGPPYAGISGGAVGGAPAQRRSSGGRTGHGLSSGGGNRGDTTIGAKPSAADKSTKEREERRLAA